MSIHTLTKQADVSYFNDFKSKSVLYFGYHNREHYLSDLVHRLKKIPQIFSAKNARNRYDHIVNGIKIIEDIVSYDMLKDFNLSAAQLDQLRINFLLHDIGHPLYGHAGERSVNDFLTNFDSSFDNSTFSILLQDLHIEKGDNPFFIFGENLFSTAPLKRTGLTKHQNWLVEFVDDVENLIGDLRDLVCMLDNYESKQMLKELLIKPDQLDMRCLINNFYKSYKKELSSVSKYFDDDQADFIKKIKEMRKSVGQIVAKEAFILKQDTIWYDKVSSDLHRTHAILIDMFEDISVSDLANHASIIEVLKIN